MRDNKVIDELGGGAKIAEALAALGHNVTPEQVYMWKVRDRIPPEWRPRIADLADAKPIRSFDRDKFVFAFKPRKQRARSAA